MMIMPMSSTMTFLFFLNDKSVIEDNDICLKKKNIYKVIVEDSGICLKIFYKAIVEDNDICLIVALCNPYELNWVIVSKINYFYNLKKNYFNPKLKILSVMDYATF